MNKEFRFRFDNKAKRETCPICLERKVFTRYIDIKKEEQLPEEYGICTRLSCGHHMNPYKDGFAARLFEQEKEGREETAKQFLNKVRASYKRYETKPQGSAKPVKSNLPPELFTSSLQGFNTSSFFKFLTKVFGEQKAAEIACKYYLGALPEFRFRNKEFPGYNSPEGAVIFWRISYEGRPHSGKVMLYDPQTGKRVKQPFDHINWVHILNKLPTEEPMKFFFGEHWLRLEGLKPVMMHEAEKTAIIASGYLPEYIHLACGGLAMLTPERCKVLEGRKVILVPDLDGFERWKAKAEEFGFGLFTLHKERADQAGIQGAKFDLADFLLNIPFAGKKEPEPKPEPSLVDQAEKMPEFISEFKTEAGYRLVKIKFKNGEFKKVLFDQEGDTLNLMEHPEPAKQLFRLFGSGFEAGLICGLPALLAPCREEEEPGLNWEPIINKLKMIPEFRHKLTLPDGRRIEQPSRKVREIIHSVQHGSQCEELFNEALFIIKAVIENPYLVISHKEKNYNILINQYKLKEYGTGTYKQFEG